MALAFGDEADQAEAAQKADNAAQLRNETWAGIDTLVREFIPEAVRRGIKPKATGIIRRSRAVEFWDVQSSKSKRDSLTITTDGNWALHREVPNGHTEWLTDRSTRPPGRASARPADCCARAACDLLQRPSARRAEAVGRAGALVGRARGAAGLRRPAVRS